MSIKTFRFFSWVTASCALLLSADGLANAINDSMTLPVHIVLSTGQIKPLHLPRVPLSQEQKQAFAQHRIALQHSRSSLQAKQSLASEVELGMAGVPVLDQGAWGTCATFAATAGVDALLGLTSTGQISQLCNLQLGRTLKLPDSDGGWEGSFGWVVLGQLDQYGFVPVTYQQSKGCGGLTDYPTYSVDNGSPMLVSEFTAASIRDFHHQDWSTVLPFNRRFRPLSPEKGEIVLAQVKEALAGGNRILFGTLIDASKGDAGSYGSYHAIKDDAWVLTNTILRNITRGRAVAGHEMLITGYMDQACASYVAEDHSEKQQCGLLRLRNSWSSYAGEQGDYFMTYDYFKTMVVEAYVLGKNIAVPNASSNV